MLNLNARPWRSAVMTTFSTEVLDNEVLPSSLGSIAPILRIANELESQRPRVAYLFRYHAFEKAHKLDQSSSGRGVRQFKIALLQRLQTDNESSQASRIKKTDALEIESYYQHYYEHYIRALDHGKQADRAQLGKAYQTAGALFEVLCCVNKYEKVEEVAPELPTKYVLLSGLLRLLEMSKKRRKSMHHTTVFLWMLLCHHNLSCSVRRLRLLWLPCGTLMT